MVVGEAKYNITFIRIIFLISLLFKKQYFTYNSVTYSVLIDVTVLIKEKFMHFIHTYIFI